MNKNKFPFDLLMAVCLAILIASVGLVALADNYQLLPGIVGGTP